MSSRDRLNKLIEEFGEEKCVSLMDKLLTEGLRSMERIEHFTDEEYDFFRLMTSYMRDCLK